MPSIVCETWFISFSSYKFPELSSTAPAERVRKLQQCAQGGTAGEGHSREKSEALDAWAALTLIYGAAPLPRMHE